jgi:hypothetical protein
MWFYFLRLLMSNCSYWCMRIAGSHVGCDMKGGYRGFVTKLIKIYLSLELVC